MMGMPDPMLAGVEHLDFQAPAVLRAMDLDLIRDVVRAELHPVPAVTVEAGTCTRLAALGDLVVLAGTPTTSVTLTVAGLAAGHPLAALVAGGAALLAGGAALLRTGGAR